MSLDAQSRRTSGLRVLVVEDEMMVVLLLEEMLADLGHTVVGPVAHLGAALEMAEHDALDVAILDGNLDGQESYPVAAALAARDIPFIFSTGYSRERLRDPYCHGTILQKPFQERELQKALAAAGRA
jgi:CheY-like chemotaxis protein